MPEDPYVYPGTDTLRNRLGIRKATDLAEREAALSSIRLAQLERRFIAGDYDVTHLQATHRYIFGDLYSWAGELRTVRIAKGGDLFALPEHIGPYLTTLFAELAQEGALQGLEREQFVERLTHYYAEINAVHPFREGNGRTQRAFLGQIAKAAGRPIAWARLDAERNIHAARESHRGDSLPLREMLSTLLL
jgi:cell filamentation protein